MKTTIVLDDGLARQLKQAAAASGKTMASLIEDALRQFLVPPRQRSGGRITLPTYGGGSILAGVDLDDSAALLDLMEDRVDSSRR
ncbi:MAG: CopG family transcriptional regulator [Actinomycetota bacterium]